MQYVSDRRLTIKENGLVMTHKLVNIQNVIVNLVFIQSIDFPTSLHMWTYLDNDDGLRWFEYMFNLVTDLTDRERAGLTLDETLSKMNQRLKSVAKFF